MSTLLGSTSAGTGTYEFTGDNNGNAIAGALTLPAGGPWRVPTLGAYFGGKSLNATSRLVAWNTSGTVLGKSNTFGAGSYTYPSAGTSHEADLITPIVVAGSTTILVGFETAPLDDRLWRDKTSGTQYYKTDTSGSWPTDGAFTTQVPGPPGVWLYYDASNSAPTAPTLNSPISAAVVTSQSPTLNFTHHDPDADAANKYTYQVDNNSDFSSTVESVEVVVAIADGANRDQVVAATLSRGTTYYWRVKTSDATNGYGAYSAAESFKVASKPTATVTTPTTGHTAKVYYDAGTNTTPHFEVTWSYNCADSHTQASASVKVYADSGGSPGSLLHTHAHTGATVTAQLTGYAPTNGTKYHISVTPTCTSIAGTESTQNICRVRWARASYFYSLGLTPTGWGTPAVATTESATSKVTIEYAATASSAEPSTWYSSFGPITVNTYLWHRVTLTAWGSATPTGPSVQSVAMPYTTTSITPDSWTLPDAQSSVDEGTQFYGTQSLKIVQDNTGTDRVAYQTVTVLPDTKYILAGRVKATGNPSASVAILSADRSTVIVESTPIVATADWAQEATAVFNSGGATQLTVMCRTRTGGAGTAWFDAVKLEASTIVTPWTPGFLSGGVVIDASGLQVDGSAGGKFRLRGSTGGAGDTVTLGTHGLDLGTTAVIDIGADTFMRRSAAKTIMFDTDGAGTALTKVSIPGALEVHGSAAFPGSPATNDLYYRTDHGMWFFYDGTRWLSAAVYKWFDQHSDTNVALSATTASIIDQACPIEGTDIYLLDHTVNFFIAGGTALSGSHSWFGDFFKRPTGNTDTAIVQHIINSGSLSVWRTLTYTINALLNNGTQHYVFARTWTKTGTPGDIYWSGYYRYRIVAT